MRNNKIGRTSIEVSQLCLGTMTFGWTTDTQVSFNIMDAARDAGITFFDTANMYSMWADGNSGGESETVIGEWLKDKPRDEFVIATKARARMWAGDDGEGLSKAHLVRAVEDSLRRLQTDYIDLYQAHWFDADTPIEETLRAMDDLVSAGKVRIIGASNYPAWRLTKSMWASDVNDTVRYECLQPHYSLLHRDEFESELADLCLDQQIGVIPYSPLAAGFLTGKYTREAQQVDSTRQSGNLISSLRENPRAFDVLDVAREIAAAHDVPVAQVALAWLIHQPVVTAPIVGARTLEQFEQVAGAMNLSLSEDEIARLNEVSEGF